MTRLSLFTLLLLGCSENSISQLDSPADTGAPSDTDTDADSDADSDSDTDADSDADADADSDADTDADSDADSDADTDADADADSDADTGANPCGDPLIEPYVTGGPFGGFQSVAGTGFQSTITVTLPCPANRVEVTILDPDFAGNQMIAYDGTHTELGRASFVGDATPSVFTTDTQSISATNIASVELVPDPADYVAYSLVVYY